MPTTGFRFFDPVLVPLVTAGSDELTWDGGYGSEVRPGLSDVWLRSAGALRSPLASGRVVPLAAAAAWEVQSYLATAALYGMLVLTSFWLTFPMMLAWSLLATVVFFHGRKHGMPDLFVSEPLDIKQRWGFLGNLSLNIGRIGLVGIQPFIYSRTACRLLNGQPTRCHRKRLAQRVVLGIGLILFGVTATHHMLSRAGYSGGSLLGLGLVGSLCNVTYRVLISAAMVGAVSHAISLLVRV